MDARAPINVADPEMEPKTAQAAELVPAEALRGFMARSDWRAWTQVLSHLGAIGVTGYWLNETWGSWWGVPLFLLQGVLLAYLYAAQHEFSHLTPFRTRWLNLFWGHAVAFLRLKPFHYDRMYHMLHHQFTRIRGRDTELDSFTAELKPFTLREYLAFLLAFNMNYRLLRVLVLRLGGKMFPRDREFSETDRIRFVVEAWFYVAGYAAIAALSIHYETWLALKIWLGPWIAMKWTHQLHNTAEHYGLPKVSDILTNTRTIYTTPFNRWLVWQMTYHTAHHRYANVPFYNLRKVDRLIRPHVKHTTDGYLRFHWRLLKAAWRGRRFGYEGQM